MNISGISESQLTYGLLKRGLDASAERQNVISNNLSNINTKGYKRSYVNFEENLKDSIDNIEMEKTDPRHMDNGKEYGAIQVKQDDSTSMNEDGNNVDIDTEMADEAKNALTYYALINQINGRISMTSSVINGR